MSDVAGQYQDPAAWSATVTQVGRWRYEIVLVNDIVERGPTVMGVLLGWSAWGHSRAHRKAARKLARHRRQLTVQAARRRSVVR